MLVCDASPLISKKRDLANRQMPTDIKSRPWT